MSNLEKLDKVIVEFEDQVKELSSYKDLYAEISKMGEYIELQVINFDKVEKKIKELNSNFNTTLVKIDSQIEKNAKLINSLNDVPKVLDNKFKDLSKATYDSMDCQFNEIKKGIKIHFEKSNEKYEQILKSNKEFLNDLRTYTESKLEKFKSDIEVTIRNEGTQIQRGFETTINQNFTKIEQLINSKIDTLYQKNETILNKNQKHFTVSIVILVLLVVNIITGLIIYMR